VLDHEVDVTEQVDVTQHVAAHGDDVRSFPVVFLYWIVPKSRGFT
jgi:hypothetical protein